MKTSDNSFTYLFRMPDVENVPLSEKRALHSRWATSLVEFAVRAHFDGATVQKTDGKWVCDKCYVSVSHSGKYVAAAVGETPLGVDLQKISDQVPFSAIAKRLFTEKERQQLAESDDKILTFHKIWCKKEALWKSLDEQPPTIAPVETSGMEFTEQLLQCEGETYCFAVTGKTKITLISKPD